MKMCSIDGCTKKSRVHRMCTMHHGRWQRNGDPLVVRRRQVVPELCEFEGCNKPYQSRGWCSMHYSRWRAHGDPAITLRANGGPDPTYGAMHRRLSTVRGRAADHACAHCHAPAKDWAYDHADPDERTEVVRGLLMPYSTDAGHYMPLCRSCHTSFDLTHIKESA